MEQQINKPTNQQHPATVDLELPINQQHPVTVEQPINKPINQQHPVTVEQPVNRSTNQQHPVSVVAGDPVDLNLLVGLERTGAYHRVTRAQEALNEALMRGSDEAIEMAEDEYYEAEEDYERYIR